jgi:hypothetical protein
MSQNTARFMLSRSTEWGVCRVYGYPGDGIDGRCDAEPYQQEVDLQGELDEILHR